MGWCPEMKRQRIFLSILDRQIVNSAGAGDADLVRAYDLYNKSTVRVADGDYIRLKSVRLSYNVPGRWYSENRRYQCTAFC